MKLYTLYSLVVIFFLVTSCTEKYQLPNPGGQTTIVITGLITNEPGPYYVRVAESISDMVTGQVTVRGINDAVVTITDSDGHIDELRSFWSVEVDSVVYASGTIWETGEPYAYYNYYINIPDGDGGYVEYYLSPWSEEDSRDGNYFTTSTRGTPGRAYTLTVEYDGRIYTSTDYMCHGTVIDSVSVEPVGRYVYDKPDGTDGFMVPCLYFAEPQDETNFYMFMESSTTMTYLTEQEEYESRLDPVKNLTLRAWRNSEWYISVISDRFLPAYVSRYKMSDGDSPRKYYSGTDMGFYQRWETAGDIDMYCISEPVYRYYYALSQQYYDDGGAFSPSPATPPTNISGGAQGCFSAAPVSQYRWKKENSHEE